MSARELCTFQLAVEREERVPPGATTRRRTASAAARAAGRGWQPARARAGRVKAEQRRHENKGSRVEGGGEKESVEAWREARARPSPRRRSSSRPPPPPPSLHHPQAASSRPSLLDHLPPWHHRLARLSQPASSRSSPFSSPSAPSPPRRRRCVQLFLAPRAPCDHLERAADSPLALPYLPHPSHAPPPPGHDPPFASTSTSFDSRLCSTAPS